MIQIAMIKYSDVQNLTQQFWLQKIIDGRFFFYEILFLTTIKSIYFRVKIIFFIWACVCAHTNTHIHTYNVHNENHELGTMTGRRRLRVLKTIAQIFHGNSSHGRAAERARKENEVEKKSREQSEMNSAVLSHRVVHVRVLLIRKSNGRAGRRI